MSKPTVQSVATDVQSLSAIVADLTTAVANMAAAMAAGAPTAAPASGESSDFMDAMHNRVHECKTCKRRFINAERAANCRAEGAKRPQGVKYHNHA